MATDASLTIGMQREDHDGWHVIVGIEYENEMQADGVRRDVVVGYWLADNDGREHFMGVTEVWGTWRLL